jgi:hypothetical protein
VEGEDGMCRAQQCEKMTFLLLLHSLETILFLSLLLLMDINLTIRGTEFTVAGVLFV